MTDQPEFIRPDAARVRFGTTRRTLERWAAAGRIGKSKDGRAVYYVASDIADVIRLGLTPRTIVPVTTQVVAKTDDDWRSDPFWAGTSAACP